MLRYDKCVYWESLGANDYGQREFAAPIEITCRWEDKVEEFMDDGGNKLLSAAVVYVDRKLTLLGVLWHGLLTPAAPGVAWENLPLVTDSVNPFGNDGAKEIRKYGELPDLRNKDRLRTVWL